jgi:hypothetical protein
MTRTLSTPVAGDAVRGAICEELEPGVEAEFAVEPVQAVSPSEIASTEAAAPRRHRPAYRPALLTGTTFPPVLGQIPAPKKSRYQSTMLNLWRHCECGQLQPSLPTKINYPTANDDSLHSVAG